MPSVIQSTSIVAKMHFKALDVLIPLPSAESTFVQIKQSLLACRPSPNLSNFRHIMEQLARVSKKLGSVGQIELLQILMALSVGAKACSGGRICMLWRPRVRPGVERAAAAISARLDLARSGIRSDYIQCLYHTSSTSATDSRPGTHDAFSTKSRPFRCTT